MITRRTLMQLLAGAALPALSGCGRSAGYRYKLTLAVDTPSGVKSAFNVVEIYSGAVSIPASGVIQKAKGEALYLDLGPGRRPLIALLGRSSWSRSNPFPDHPGAPRPERPFQAQWRDNNPTHLLYFLSAPNAQVRDDVDVVHEVSRATGVRTLTTYDLPDLVTFADVNDPKSVLRVDPNDLEATLGPGVKWRRLTIEIADERLTTGIEQQLLWLSAMPTSANLAGQSGGGTIASPYAVSLQPADFQHKEFF